MKKNKRKTKKAPVIRKLRIEFIIVMMAIVVVFLAVIFGVQYFSSKRTLRNEKQEALTNALNSVIFLRDDMSIPGLPGDLPFPDGNNMPEIPPDESTENENNRENDNDFFRRGGRNLSDFRDKSSRTATLVAVIDSEGSVTIRQNNIFFIEQEDVDGLIKNALASTEENGMIEDHDLEFMKKGMNNGSTAIAFVDNSSDTSMLRSELIRSIWISLAVIVVMFLLSLILSKLTIRPVERAWEDQRRFVADASHELKTPLTVIMSNTDMVERSLKNLRDETGADPDSETRNISTRKLDRNLHRVENVREESLRMKELIGELLEVARGDVGQNVTEFQDVDLSELANDALLSWESMFFEKGKILTGDIDEDLHMNGDRVTLRRLIEILIDNALKYSSEKAETSICLKREKSGSRRVLHLSVANEGTPLTDEEISHLFDRFYRADSSREMTSGYGLGLSIAASVAEAHKGKIWAAADGDRGNIFHVTFPV